MTPEKLRQTCDAITRALDRIEAKPDWARRALDTDAGNPVEDQQLKLERAKAKADEALPEVAALEARIATLNAQWLAAIQKPPAAQPSEPDASPPLNDSFPKQLLAYGAGLVSAALSWVLGFGVLASWNGAVTRFSEEHVVLGIALGVSTLLIGALAAGIGVATLVVPASSVGTYAFDTSGHRIKIGSSTSRMTTKESLAFLGFGWLWNVVAGVIVLLGAR